MQWLNQPRHRVLRLIHGDIYLPQACICKVSKAFSSITYEHPLVSIIMQ
jgi:hypothetical protein